MVVSRRSLRHLMLALLAVFPLLALAGGEVDINRADAGELARALDGIGPAKAAAIVEDREANGPFLAADELTRVSGVGPSTLEANRGRIRIDVD